jgi:hypothetical protein
MQVKDADGKMVMDYWETAKKMMADSYFLESLKAFDKDNIDPEIIQKLQPIITKEDFDPKKVLKVSKAAFGLASWVRAMDTYDRVAKVVGPKKQALGEAEAKLQVCICILHHFVSVWQIPPPLDMLVLDVTHASKHSSVCERSCHLRHVKASFRLH